MALTKVTSAGLTDDSIVNADINSSAAVALSKLATDPSNATNLASGTVPTARLGSGTASSSTVLYGDQTYKAEPGLTGWTTGGTSNSLIPSATDQGIYLGVSSATAENLLDDYETGTWTAAYTAGSGTVTADSSNDLMTYTKIGRFVFVTGYCNISSVSTPSGTLTMTGFPFTAGGTTEGAWHSSMNLRWTYQSGSAGILMAYVQHAGTTMLIEYNDGQTTSQSAVAQKMTSSSSYMLGGGYATN